jgi:predicted DNA-binding transcriptional regulator YafY
MSPRKKGRTYGKYSRALELFFALMCRRDGATLKDLQKNVEEYHEEYAKADTVTVKLKRAFDRDRNLLREIGCEVTLVPTCAGEAPKYRIDREHTFLPTTLSGGQDGNRPVPLPSSVSAEVIGLLESAVLRLEAEGDVHLTAAAGRVLQKLAGPVARITLQRETAVERAARKRESGALMALIEAHESRKAISFDYHSPYREVHTQRTVHPYGLFRQNGQLYLVCADQLRNEMRKLRVDRIHSHKVNRENPRRADYTVPSSFDIKAYSIPNNPWEMGSSSPQSVTVRLAVCNGATLPMAQRGTPQDDHQLQWSYTVCDVNTFCKWTLAYAGEIMVETPEEVVDAWQTLALDTLALYLRPPVHQAAPPRKRARKARPSERLLGSAADQLSRMLMMIQLFGDGKPRSRQEIADRLGVPPKQVKHDLDSLLRRPADVAGMQPSYWIFEGDNEDVWEIGVIDLIFREIRAPLMLSWYEVGAMDLGLRLLQDELLAEDLVHWTAARQLIRSLRGVAPRSDLAGAESALMEPGGDARRDPRTEQLMLRLVQAIRQRQVIRMNYMARHDAKPYVREVHPYRLVEQRGVLYLEAWCLREGKWKLYLLERLHEVMETGETFKRDPDYRPSNDQWQKTLAKAPQQLVVRYTGQAARLEAEYEGVGVEADGSLTWRYPLADEAWGIRKVLHYGPEAEALAPESVREGIRTRLRAVLGEA